MSAQDRLEQVLRDIHILLSQSEVYDKETNRVIVDKREMLILLKSLNTGIYSILEECELTQQSRDAAERELRKRNEQMIADANHKAEDVYAASILYTDEALSRVQGIMQQTMDSFRKMYDVVSEDLQKEKRVVQRDQSELKGHLQDLADTDKYLKIIEDRNKELLKEKDADKELQTPAYASVKPEIKINAEYFERAGIPLEGETPEEEWQEDEKKEPVMAEVSVNLDAEYFKWINESGDEKEPEKKAEKHTLLGKILK